MMVKENRNEEKYNALPKFIAKLRKVKEEDRSFWQREYILDKDALALLDEKVEARERFKSVVKLAEKLRAIPEPKRGLLKHVYIIDAYSKQDCFTAMHYITGKLISSGLCCETERVVDVTREVLENIQECYYPFRNIFDSYTICEHPRKEQKDEEIGLSWRHEKDPVFAYIDLKNKEDTFEFIIELERMERLKSYPIFFLVNRGGQKNAMQPKSSKDILFSTSSYFTKLGIIEVGISPMTIQEMSTHFENHINQNQIQLSKQMNLKKLMIQAEKKYPSIEENDIIEMADAWIIEGLMENNMDETNVDEKKYSDKDVDLHGQGYVYDSDEIDMEKEAGSYLLEEMDKEKEPYYEDDSDMYDDFLELENEEDLYQGNPMDELDALIGLEEHKEQIRNMVLRIKFNMYREEMGLPCVNSGMNAVFLGPPGTAKTTLGRLIAKIFRYEGIITGNKFKECKKSDLVGKFVGWTTDKVDNLFKGLSNAGGGVILFDEIYTLAEEENTVFDTEALTSIVQNMEIHRNVVCIFAGYPDKMHRFLEANPGLRSRIPFSFYFNHYTNDELIKIFEYEVEKNQFILPKNYRLLVEECFEELKIKRKEHFGNGREARNLFEIITIQMGARFMKSNKEITSEGLKTIYKVDIQKAIKAILGKEAEIKEKKIGFQYEEELAW